MSEAIDLQVLARVPLICPGYRIRVAERLATRLFNARFKALGLSAVQFGLLVGIETSDRPMVADLAEKSGADPSTLARNMKLLETQGLVISVGGRGRFGKRFELSERGRFVLCSAVDIWQKTYEELVSDLGLTHIQQGLTFLMALEDGAKKRLASGSGSEEDGAGNEEASQLPMSRGTNRDCA